MANKRQYAPGTPVLFVFDKKNIWVGDVISGDPVTTIVMFTNIPSGPRPFSVPTIALRKNKN